jgi:Ca-activated chloride channel homolog
MNFAHPWWLLIGVAVLGIVVGYLLALRRTRRDTMRFANLELLEKVAPKRPSRLRHAPVGVLLVGMILLTVAMAGPTGTVKVPRNRAVVMLAIDVSLSMEATDVAPNRLDAAKEAATSFVNELTPGVNLGLVSFAGIATVLVSPTTDRQAVDQAIQGLKLDERTATGEAIISCIQTIQLFAKTLTAADGSSDPPPARIVMMTDGKRTVGRTEQEAAQMAAAAKIPVSMIAFGTSHGTITEDGSQIPVPLDTSAMQQIAQISGGDFHTAATADELKSVYAQLGEQIGYETKQQDTSRPWLIAGTLCVIIGAAVGLVLSRRIP